MFHVKPQTTDNYGAQIVAPPVWAGALAQIF
jgi:hypothetical protein